MTCRFGVQLAPDLDRLDEVLRLAQLADREGIELLGIQDHPYAATQVDTFSVIATVLATTQRIRVFPDVANLPLRPPAVLAKAAATLDLLSGGRFELGLGAGGYPAPIVAMGGPGRAGGEALAALTEAVEIIRAMWKPGDRVRFEGTHYQAAGVRSGPAPAHPIGIWFGSVGPRANALTGQIADGWAAPIPHYLPYEAWPGVQATISAAATEAGRDPRQVMRMAQLVGHITDAPGTVALQGEEPIRTDTAGWARVIAHLATDVGFDTFVYWPQDPSETQLLRWAREVIPAASALLAG